ncbi:hypothetical protein KL86DYS1_11482 [uncultured Dysgonomonas sp.]|uniref:Uncharacterized protein n=1 Tax=uncultured Dysgonomonas sp. TaxID=206096 RepID=A0A212J8K9_9BACT|nr:hypothetical protein KL86DYS1_11482 [uncultured Dysgonomonas sp.]
MVVRQRITLYKIKETAISYITQLAKLENHKLPEKLIQIYEKAYSLFIYFFDFDLFPFCSNVRRSGHQLC